MVNYVCFNIVHILELLDVYIYIESHHILHLYIDRFASSLPCRNRPFKLKTHIPRPLFWALSYGAPAEALVNLSQFSSGGMVGEFLNS